MPSRELRSRVTVLVVDDNRDNRELYAEYLRFRGFIVLEATNGGEALDMAFAQPPDFAVVDVMMPGIDGLAVTRALKADARTRATVVLVLTAKVLGDARERAKEAGADTYLPKPCSPEDLLAAIRRHLPRGSL